MSSAPRFRVFISYSHADEAWGKWLHQKLERYRVPSRLVGRTTPRGVVPRRIGRCFRDQAELSAATHLGEALKEALRDSQTLIVICSPRSAGSHWVNEEVAHFRSLGKGDAIYALVVDGEPNAKDPARECLPPSLREAEPLAADVRESADGKSDGFLRLVSGILGVSFDDLRQRERTRRRRLLIATVAASLAIATVTTVLAVAAYHARNEATARRQQADRLINFMLGDLQDQLAAVGRLDVLDATVAEAMSYLRTDEANQAAASDATALTQRSRALAAIAEIQYARGQLTNAIATAQEALTAARTLQTHFPGDASDEATARAIYALAEPSLEGGAFDTITPLTREGLTLARELAERTPGNHDRTLLLARFLDELAFIDGNGPNIDYARAHRGWRECIDLVAPLAQGEAAKPTYVRFLARCELQMGISLASARKMDEATERWLHFVALSGDAKRRFPRDQALLYLLQAGLANATLHFSDVGKLDAAVAASTESLEVGRQLVSFDPANVEWQRALAVAFLADLDLRIERKDWDQARRSADEAASRFDDAMARNPDSVQLRRAAIDLYRLRALVEMKQAQPRQVALSEIARGLALARADDSPVVQASLLSLRQRQWLLAMEDGNATLAREAEGASRDLLDQLSAAAFTKDMDRAKAAFTYMEGRIEDGDELFAKLKASPAYSGSWIEEFRSAACARRVKKGGAACD